MGTPVHGKDLYHKVGGIEQRTLTKNIGIDVNVDTVEVQAAGDTAKKSLEGIYGWKMGGDYLWDGLSGNIDHMILTQITSGPVIVQVIPFGATGSANMPRFHGSSLITSYSIQIPADGVITCKAEFQGTGILNRYLSGT